MKLETQFVHEISTSNVIIPSFAGIYPSQLHIILAIFCWTPLCLGQCYICPLQKGISSTKQLSKRKCTDQSNSNHCQPNEKAARCKDIQCLSAQVELPPALAGSLSFFLASCRALASSLASVVEHCGSSSSSSARRWM